LLRVAEPVLSVAKGSLAATPSLFPLTAYRLPLTA